MTENSLLYYNPSDFPGKLPSFTDFLPISQFSCISPDDDTFSHLLSLLQPVSVTAQHAVYCAALAPSSSVSERQTEKKKITFQASW